MKNIKEEEELTYTKEGKLPLNVLANLGYL